MLVTNVTHSVVNFIHFILEIPFLTTFHPTQFMRFSNTSFRFRIALVLVAVGGLSALLMGFIGKIFYWLGARCRVRAGGCVRARWNYS